MMHLLSIHDGKTKPESICSKLFDKIYNSIYQILNLL